MYGGSEGATYFNTTTSKIYFQKKIIDKKVGFRLSIQRILKLVFTSRLSDCLAVLFTKRTPSFTFISTVSLFI